MTGYGKGESSKHNRRLSVEIRAVNHRNSDLAIREPKALNPFDALLRQEIGKRVFRGKLDISISLESLSIDDVKVALNTALADMYHERMKELISRYSLPSEVTLADLMRHSDILSLEKPDEDEGAQAEVWEALCEALNLALDGLCSMRESEGQALKRDMLEKIRSVRGLVADVKERSPQASADYAEKLKNRLAELLGNHELDEGRLLTEIMLMADKTCVDEEITRAESHLSQLEGFLESDEPIGRKLDFLVQELNREVNTIGSKCSDLAITKDVVEMKSEIEKIREQVQNIE
jgi:uncharacterized protein (TIGR00255 family)